MYTDMEVEKSMVCSGTHQQPCDAGLCMHGWMRCAGVKKSAGAYPAMPNNLDLPCRQRGREAS